jgi:hypothetical protein
LKSPLLLEWPSEANPALGPQLVVLEILIDEQGKVETASLISGQEPFASAAIAIALTLEFSPALEAGVPVATVMPLNLSFLPPPVPEPPPPDRPGILGFYNRTPDDPLYRSLDPESARLLPGTLGDPLRAVQNLPGTVRMPLDSGWLIVRGGNPRDTAIHVDGLRVPSLQHIGGFTSILHPAWFERLDFWAGGFPAHFGHATAGVVDVTTLSQLDREIRGGINVVFADVFAAVPVGKATVGVALRRSYLDSLLGLVAESDAVPSFWDGQLRLDIGPARFFGLGYRDQVSGTTPSGNQVILTLSTLRLQEKTSFQRLELAPFVAWDVAQVEVIDTEEFRVDEAISGGLKLDLEFLAGFRGGVELELERRSVRAEELIRFAWVGMPEGFLSYQLGEGDRALQAGIRLDSLLVEGQLPRFGLSPRILGIVPVGPVALTADIGIYHQPPPEDLLIGPPDGAVLELEEAYSAGFGARIKLEPAGLKLGFRSDAFGRYLKNPTLWERDGTLGQGHGLAFGLENELELEHGKLLVQAAYTWSRSLRQEESGLLWEPSSVDQPHTLNLIAGYDLGKDWIISGRFRYSSGLPTPVFGGTAVDLLTGESVPLEGVRLPAFHSLDIKISKSWLVRRTQVSGWLDIENIYNHRIPEPVLTSLSDVYATYVFSLPVLPVVGLEVGWK